MAFYKWLLPVLVTGLAVAAAHQRAAASEASGGLTLEQAVERAQSADPWLTGSRLQQEAYTAQSASAGSLPDPVVSLGIANLPTDTFEFDQEPMTQFKVGISQQFPRGDIRELEARRLALMSEREPALREDRRARVAVAVSLLWLDAYRAQRTIRLIDEDRSLFEYLVEVAQSSYASALGRTRQQDIIRAQLELTSLEDRLTTLHQQLDAARSSLGEWLDTGGPTWQSAVEISPLDSLPTIRLTESQALQAAGPLDEQMLSDYLLSHPAVIGLENKIAVDQTGVSIARQKYRPQWGINASYGYRDEDPAGMDRADFFSLGVTFDLPLFTGNRQDKEVQAAVARAESTRTDKALLVRSMRAKIATHRARLLRLNQRKALFDSQLLSQMHEQAEAALSAYTSDDGDFAEVVRARISELNAKVDALNIEVERAMSMVQLNYFFIGDRSHAPAARGGVS